MPAMKVTPDAAMRARDVSRPHAEHLAWADEAEASAADAAGVAVVADGSAEESVVTEAGDAVETEVAAEAEMTAGWPTYAGRADAGRADAGRADAGRADAGRGDGDRGDGQGRVEGTRRRRVRSSRRGRPSR